MKTSTTLAAIGLAALAASCGCLHKLPQTETRDSVVTVIRDSTVWRDSIIYVEVPRESYAVETPDDSSHLETSLAESEAVVRGGRLRHTLKNKPDSRLGAKVALPSRWIVTTATTASKTQMRQVVEVERRLTWWQETKMKCGAAALIIAGAMLLWLAIKTLILKRRGLI